MKVLKAKYNAENNNAENNNNNIKLETKLNQDILKNNLYISFIDGIIDDIKGGGKKYSKRKRKVILKQKKRKHTKKIYKM